MRPAATHGSPWALTHAARSTPASFPISTRGGPLPLKLPSIHLQLFDPRQGDLACTVERWDKGPRSLQAQRSNYFTIILISTGEGVIYSGAGEGRLTSPTLLFFNPYQTFRLDSNGLLQAAVIRFHANFFCIETQHHAVGCNGVLFNNVYSQAGVRLTESLAAEFDELIAQMERELLAGGVAHGEIVVALLKVFLVKATRLKLQESEAEPEETVAPARTPQILDSLMDLIEQHFPQWHAPAEYAAALHITPKALGKLVKARFGRTLTELIRQRLLQHAKWQLLHTTRSVKEIAWELGFADEFYFSRLFKRTTGLAPTAFRDFETAIRAGRNLSM